MTNTNCLENRRCPECGQQDTITVEAVKRVTVTDEGIDSDGDTFYDENSWAKCTDCDHEGNWKDFCADRQGREKGLTNELRAELVAHAVDAYAIKKAGAADYDSPVSIAHEMMADLLHFIRAHYSDPSKAIDIARGDFEVQEAREAKPAESPVAPEMLEALRDAKETIGALSNDVDGFREKFGDTPYYDHGEATNNMNETLDRIDAAIKKAKGGAA